MKVIYWILLLLPEFGLSQALPEKDTRISVGRKAVIHSAILNEDRELWVYVPASYVKGSSNNYPVIYLLDGPSFFHSVTGMVQYLSSIGKIPEMIVVGISNTNRVRDLTPTHSIQWSDGEQDTAVLGSSGGGEKFIAFIEQELIPYVDAAYATTPYRMLVGHSLGGLTVLNALVSHASLFTSYVALDPSIWWDKQHLIKSASTQQLRNDYSKKSLYYATANKMNQAVDTLSFIQLLQRNSQAKLKWKSKFYPEDNHVSVPLIGTYDALRFLFDGYELDKELSDSSITVEYIRNHYQKQSALLDYQVLPSEAIVNALGYISLQRKNFDRAFQFFSLNLENYPASANALDSMGDFYLEKKDSGKAMEYFRKSLKLAETPETRKKLNRLETKAEL
jgi:predicted alpha/beta superfamily hydrolase